VRKHCDYSESNPLVAWDERHSALGFSRSLLVETLGFGLFSAVA
jgi:hypothetical protein